jgi:rhodanese-related sulfurtransferase
MAKARAAAERVAARFSVKSASADEVAKWKGDAARTLYLLDVRTREEFERSHLAGSRHAPGGQLVQASDEYVGVRNARVVLIDPEKVRAVMTASWLNQMGWNDVYVLEGGWESCGGTESGPRSVPVLGFNAWQTTPEPAGTVLDFSTSLRFYARHVPGAWWVVRSRLDEAKGKISEKNEITLTSEDGVLAHLAAPDVAQMWPGAQVRVLERGNAAWFAAGNPAESGVDRATTVRDDVWYKPYDHTSDYEKHARDYLAWEVALVEQIRRDPLIRFRAYDA